jgi:hypothetical protein
MQTYINISGIGYISDLQLFSSRSAKVQKAENKKNRYTVKVRLSGNPSIGKVALAAYFHRAHYNSPMALAAYFHRAHYNSPMALATYFHRAHYNSPMALATYFRRAHYNSPVALAAYFCRYPASRGIFRAVPKY